ncbi:ABC transporter ATP-binding protein [Leucobacter sp. OLJS4]|uniref:ABC transporter ATP-binding protein n=1 Tax=unclassified Leucobacter TaxID=2621730 RepID=UPI000C1A3368|nr:MULTISPECIES: ABC transporter ATP-binding protein [unclassified Leucobacter]PII82915.1 ABC transporter ATP-binding protein [Leucobacter sp. OLCALW19]PII87977.1 ABC transporter ATP-binding protein [Leucobacter sp. OLTLW20]PII91835.1 ABC transporter ATP-binding protein [Leucobacter sp. OLAS13]PII98151.1 ABC transporter ATP-binding protein [Leucobacter sp. OLCS4]PIJ00157.1 ABC transporter ATP-binding protein [Leucobacter sp. OLDS2]
MSSAPPILRLRGVRKRFGLDTALDGVDLDVRAGEVLAIMGPSGSGKSTLLHVLAGVYAPDEGSAHYLDTLVSELGEADRARLRLEEFGFVFQFGQLLPDLTALDNVALPLLIAGRPRRQAVRQAKSWLVQLGLADHAGKRPGELSGGQAQRVAIARALVTAPRIVFADEPTGSLDSLSAEQVMATLLELAKGTGATVVIVTHDPRVAAYADREVVVRDGRISGVGILA